MTTPVCLIVNPSAGGGRAGRVAPAVERELRAHGLAVRRLDTRDLDHARELAAEAADRGETVVGLSGDGMIRALADVLRDVPGAVLGVLPGGRGNDLARVLGIPEDPVAACATIAHGIARPIDLGLVSGTRPGAPDQSFVGIASAGFDSDANRIANEAPAWLGGLVYAYGALRALLSWRPARFELEITRAEIPHDGGHPDGPTQGTHGNHPEGHRQGGEPPVERRSFIAYSIGAANSRAYGGGMRAAPDALLDDGLLDVVVLESVSKLRFLTRILPKVFSGAHIHEPCVSVYRAREISLSADRPFTMYADGDPIGELPVRVRAVRGALTILTPMTGTADSPFGAPPSPLQLARFGATHRRVAHGQLMADTLPVKLALARAVGALSRLRGGGATSAPGRVLLRLDPDAIALLARRLSRGSVLVSATNGKTTTTALAASIIERAGISLVRNQAGANMAGGIASTLLAAVGPRGTLAGELGLFEVDELWLDRLATQLHPGVVVLGNLFRDQLDRYGELDTIAERWAAAVHGGAVACARLVCNADDPLIADLGRGRPGVVYYGVQDDSLALEGMAHAADTKHCRRCGAPYEFEVVYLGHLGRYHCPSCGQRRPSPTVLARSVKLEGVRSARFQLSTPEGHAEVELALPGLYNVYNALAAAALGVALEIPLSDIVDGLRRTRAAFGRAESVTVAGRQTRILLVKNPAGANEVLRTLVLESGSHDLLGVLNDDTADGRDVSWIWDADFELLAGRVRVATCSGTRAPELALRLKYAGVEPERITVVEDLAAALARAAANRVDEGGKPPLYVLPTYTAMLALRELLVARGEANSSWD